MIDQVKLELVPTRVYTRFPCALGGWTDKEGICIEVTEGDYEGFRVSPRFLRECKDIDHELEQEANRLEDTSRKLIANAAGLRALKGGRLVLPTWQDYLDAYDKHERDQFEQPVREAEAAVKELVEADAADEIVSYAKIFLAAQKAKRDAGDERQFDMPDRRDLAFDATADALWSTGEPQKAGVPVRIEVDDIGADVEDAVVVRYNIIAPMPIRLAPRVIDRIELARLCRAVGIKQLSDLDDVRFLPFVVSMDDRAEIVTWHYPDNGDLPEVQVFEEYQRPWGNPVLRHVQRTRADRPWGSPPARAD